MKESEFNINLQCGNCKRPLSEHDDIHFGTSCPNDFVEFIDHYKCWICWEGNMTQREKIKHMAEQHDIAFNPRYTEVET